MQGLWRGVDHDVARRTTRHLSEVVLNEWPDHGPTLLRYARALIELALYDKAASVLDHAWQVVSEDKRHLFLAQRGHLLECMGDLEEFEAMYLEAHAFDPDDATYLIYAGSVAFRRGDLDRAKELARKAMTCPEGCVDEAYFNLGGYLLTQGNYQEARDCYRKALEIDPDYAMAKTRLADVEGVIAYRGE